MASNSIQGLLKTLTGALETAQASVRQEAQLKPPPDGISLLDTQNELFLAYLQHLVFLILLKIRQKRGGLVDAVSDVAANEDEVQPHIVATLVELRIYLERGVKPLEGRLRYQIDKVIRAAEDAERGANIHGTASKAGSRSKKATNGRTGSHDDDDEDESDADEDAGSAAEDEELDPLAYRPNPSAFRRAGDSAASNSHSHSNGLHSSPSNDGIYRPPRISATLMPDDRAARKDRSARPQKSATMEEFIASEYSTAPVAEPSIGTTIRQGGRRSINAREQREGRDRQMYEEANFVRLPKESKAERKRQGGARARDAGWGGEEWRDLGRGADRLVGALDRRGSGRGDRVRQALERSRKRGGEGGRGESGSGGARIGEQFERSKKRKLR